MDLYSGNSNMVSPHKRPSAVLAASSDMLTKAKQSRMADTPLFNSVAGRMMEKMGFEKGGGLGKHGQGIQDIIQVAGTTSRKGLGKTSAEGFEVDRDLPWEFEEAKTDENIDWIEQCELSVPSIQTLEAWMKIGPEKLVVAGEANFVDEEILDDILQSKSIFDNLEQREMMLARQRANPFELIKGGSGNIFLNRAAFKMANIDAVSKMMFTNPTTSTGHPIVNSNELLFFADLCAGPGGFSEYILYRKKWRAKGFGFTLKGDCDFQLSKFKAGPQECLEPFYGTKGDGDIYDPENLNSFKEFVYARTEQKGVHFVMADGGFSVEGKENIQEILSKRLYLCQFLCALMVLRPGGNFVCKLFDLFTPFSVGLVYLMYRVFQNIAIFKPLTSRPANSERYIVCKCLNAGISSVTEYLMKINDQLAKLAVENREKQEEPLDVNEIVPLQMIRKDNSFFGGMVVSNNLIGKGQKKNLEKIKKFVQNPNLHEAMQVEIRDECLKKWNLTFDGVAPRVDPRVDEAPQSMLWRLLGSEATANLIRRSIENPVNLLNHQSIKSINSVYSYKCLVCGSNQRMLVLSRGGPDIHFLSVESNYRWEKLMKVKCELPYDTLLLCEVVQEMRGEGKGMSRQYVLHVVDGLVLCGEAIYDNLPYSERMQRITLMCTSIQRDTRNDLSPIRPKTTYRFEQVRQIFEKSIPTKIKGEFQEKKCFIDACVPDRKFIPTGLLLVKIPKDPWNIERSKRTGFKYYYNWQSQESVGDKIPESSYSNFCSTVLNFFYWPWNEEESSSELSRKELVDFVSEKI